MNNVFGPEVFHSPDNPVCNDVDFFDCQTELTFMKKVVKRFVRRTLVADHAARKATPSTKTDKELTTQQTKDATYL